MCYFVCGAYCGCCVVVAVVVGVVLLWQLWVLCC